MPRRSLLRTALTLGAGASLVLAACGDDTEEAAETTAAATATTAASTWAVTSPFLPELFLKMSPKRGEITALKP